MKQFLSDLVAIWKKPSKAARADNARWRVRPMLEQLEERTVPTVLFDPVHSGAEVYQINNGTTTVTMSPSQLGSNPYALNSSIVYLIFVGPKWKDSTGNEIPAVGKMIAAAQAILGPGSSYLSGLKQYGSDGKAAYGGYYVDTTLDPLTWQDPNFKTTQNNPMWWETDQILQKKAQGQAPFTSWWLPGWNGGYTAGQPIYFVVRYGGGGGGSNGFGLDSNPNIAPYVAPLKYKAVHAVDVSLPAGGAGQQGLGTQVDIDSFSRVFSHELVERISTGTADTGQGQGLRAVSGNQIGDGDPDAGNFNYHLNGTTGPVVQAYWSVVDQAFIVPDGGQQSIHLEPIWNGNSFTGNAVSLQQGHLYEIGVKLFTNASPALTYNLVDPSDPSVQSYAIASVSGTNELFYLTGKGQVMEYNGSGTPFAVVGSNTTASALISFYGTLYMMAHNTGQPTHVWRYNGSPLSWTPLSNTPTNLKALVGNAKSLYVLGNYGGTDQVFEWEGGASWTAITGTNTTVSEIETALGPWNVSTNLFMRAHNIGPDQLYQYSGSGTNWADVSNPANHVSQIAQTYGGVYVLADNNMGGPGTVWEYTGLDSSWHQLTGVTSVAQIAASGGALYMVGKNGGARSQVWQYNGSPFSWTQLTNTPTSAFSIAVDGSALYMVADNGQGMQVWQYNGSPLSWTALNDTRWVASQIQIADDGTLWMYAGYNGGTFTWWTYGGSYDQWTLSPSAFNQRIAWAG
jgi:hypothetical protein